MGRIYLVRHGQTVHNHDRVLQGPRIDGPLSELGQRQAAALGDALGRVPLDAVYTSPMQRARETAHAVVRAHPFKVQGGNPGPAQPLPSGRVGSEASSALPAPTPPPVAHPAASPLHVPAPTAAVQPPAVPRLPAVPADEYPAVPKPVEVTVNRRLKAVTQASAAREVLSPQVVPELYEMDYGTLAGRPYDDIRGEMEQVLDAWRLGFVDQAFPGGESALIAQHRIRPFAQRILQQARHADVAVVGHGRINRILAATWTGAGLTRLEEFPQSNASLTELDVGATVAVVRLNDTRHLWLATDSFS